MMMTSILRVLLTLPTGTVIGWYHCCSNRYHRARCGLLGGLHVGYRWHSLSTTRELSHDSRSSPTRHGTVVEDLTVSSSDVGARSAAVRQSDNAGAWWVSVGSKNQLTCFVPETLGNILHAHTGSLREYMGHENV